MTVKTAMKNFGGAIFKPAARYPADPRAVFILALSVFSGIVALILRESPDSLREVIPEWAVVAWGSMLAIGSLLTLVGMLFQSVNGIITEQIGSALVAATTVFYSVVVFIIVGGTAIQTVGVILAWGLACALRWIQLQVLIHSGIKRAEKNDFLRHLDEILTERAAQQAAEEAARRRKGWAQR